MGIIAVWLLLAGCSGDNSTLGAGSTGTGGSSTGSSTSASGVGGASATAIQAYCDATAEAFCEAYFACCPGPENGQWIGGTVENCKHQFRYGGSRCGDWVKAYEASIDAGHTVFDQAGLDACVVRLKSMSAGGAACVQSPYAFFLTVCKTTALQGQIALGEPCTNLPGNDANTSECKHGHCDMATHTCVPLAQLGETCRAAGGAQTSPECEWGQENFCVHQPYPNGPPICIHQGDIGDPCVQAGECKSYNCDMTSGKCALPDAVRLCW